MLYLTGIRASEAAGLRWCDLDARDSGGQLTVVGKGERVRAIRLPADAWRDVQAIRPPEAQPHDRIFTRGNGRPMHRTTITNLAAAAARRAGITAKVSAHWMRHAHASHAIENGAPITLVASTLGHVSITTTQRYIHARPEDSSTRYLKCDTQPNKSKKSSSRRSG
jgi:integrase/recombinase XerD